MFGFCNGKIILFTEINNSKRSYPTFWTAPLERKRGDLNPRYGYPYVSLANWWFQPLTHTSMSFALHFLELRCKDMLKFLNIQSIWCIILKEKRLILAHDWQSEVFNPTKVNTFFLPDCNAWNKLERGRAFGKKILFLWLVLRYSRLYIIWGKKRCESILSLLESSRLSSSC